jgi:hypothetical protein
MKVQEKQTKKIERKPLMKSVEKFGLCYVTNKEEYEGGDE